MHRVLVLWTGQDLIRDDLRVRDLLLPYLTVYLCRSSYGE